MESSEHFKKRQNNQRERKQPVGSNQTTISKPPNPYPYPRFGHQTIAIMITIISAIMIMIMTLIMIMTMTMMTMMMMIIIRGSLKKNGKREAGSGRVWEGGRCKGRREGEERRDAGEGGEGSGESG